MAENKRELAFRAYTVVKRGEGKDDFWREIGAAFPHRDGKGYNIECQALPLDGKIVLRPPSDGDEGDEPSADERPAKRSAPQNAGEDRGGQDKRPARKWRGRGGH